MPPVHPPEFGWKWRHRRAWNFAFAGALAVGWLVPVVVTQAKGIQTSVRVGILCSLIVVGACYLGCYYFVIKKRTHASLAWTVGALLAYLWIVLAAFPFAGVAIRYGVNGFFTLTGLPRTTSDPWFALIAIGTVFGLLGGVVLWTRRKFKSQIAVAGLQKVTRGEFRGVVQGVEVTMRRTKAGGWAWSAPVRLPKGTALGFMPEKLAQGVIPPVPWVDPISPTVAKELRVASNEPAFARRFAQRNGPWLLEHKETLQDVYLLAGTAFFKPRQAHTPPEPKYARLVADLTERLASTAQPAEQHDHT